MPMTSPRRTRGPLDASVMAGFVLAGLVVALPPSGATAQPAPERYTARLARPAPVASVTAGGVEWSCESVTCMARSHRDLAHVKACEALAAEVGRIVAFGPSGAAGLDGSQLEACNGDGRDDGSGEEDGDDDGGAPTLPIPDLPRTDLPPTDLPRPGCVPLELTVVADGPGDGGRRFDSLRAALRHASRAEACAVRVQLSAGEHRGSVALDRDTEIVGPDRGQAFFRGTLSMRGPHRLSVRGVHLRGAGRPGAVSVDHPEALTELSYLTVSGARGYGVRQRGGRLALDRVNVVSTSSHPAVVGSGAGILVEEGARTVLDGVTLFGNATGGLVLRGPGTRAHARTLRVTDTGAASEPGAVRISGGATLLAEGLRLDGNEVAGLHVLDGGQVHLRDGLLRRTRSAGKRGGVNVVVDGGTAELRDVTLADAGLAGLVVDGGGAVTLRNGSVARNPIGVSLRSSHPLRCLRLGTAYRDNEINLDTATPPEPDLDGRGDSEGCARVPWRTRPR